jgi:acyl carrier protein
MLSQAEISDRLNHYVSNTLVDNRIAVAHDTSFHTLGIDSMGIIELVLYLERKLGITLPEAELSPANFKSIESLAACAFRNQKS